MKYTVNDPMLNNAKMWAQCFSLTEEDANRLFSKAKCYWGSDRLAPVEDAAILVLSRTLDEHASKTGAAIMVSVMRELTKEGRYHITDMDDLKEAIEKTNRRFNPTLDMFQLGHVVDLARYVCINIRSKLRYVGQPIPS